jgi:hypothetical protein
MKGEEGGRERGREGERDRQRENGGRRREREGEKESRREGEGEGERERESERERGNLIEAPKYMPKKPAATLCEDSSCRHLLQPLNGSSELQIPLQLVRIETLLQPLDLLLRHP